MKKKQVLVIQTIVPPEILLPHWNQGLVGLVIDYIIHHRGPASNFGVSWQTGTTPFSAQVCLICKLIVVNQIDVKSGKEKSCKVKKFFISPLLHLLILVCLQEK